VAYSVPEVYESEATVAYVPPAGAPAADPAAVGARLLVALFDPRTLERVARGLTPDADHALPLSNEVMERVRRSIAARPRADQTFAIQFRAGSAAYAQHGCQELTEASVQQLDAQAAAASPAADAAAQHAKALEEQTRALAAFVAAHPEVAMSKPEASTTAASSSNSPSTNRSTPSGPDTALAVLQQEKASLEARLADAEKQKDATDRGEGNPYDPPAVHDPESLRQMIAQVKSAISARESAVARARREESSERKPAQAEPSGAADLRAEYKRLVQAVLDAQRDQPVQHETTSAWRVVQSATFPPRPIKPNRPILALVGLTSGLWMGVLWAFARVALGHDLSRARRTESRGGSPVGPSIRGEPQPIPPVAQPAAFAPTLAAQAIVPPVRRAIAALPPAAPRPPPAEQDGAGSAGDQPAIPVQAIVEDSPRPPTPSTPPTKEAFWRPPLKLRVTQRGVIDLAAVLAQTGTAAASNMPPGVNASPIVGVGQGSQTSVPAAEPVRSQPPPAADIPVTAPRTESSMLFGDDPAHVRQEEPVRRPAPLTNARTLVGHVGPSSPEPRPAPIPRTDPPPESFQEAPIPRSEAAPRPRSDPPARARSDPPLRARSDPPARPRSDPPPRARSDPPAQARSDPPAQARSDPPAQARSDPPARPRSDPPDRSGGSRADVPDSVIALRDVPSGWSPDPSLAGADSVDELRAIREQLYRFAVRGCFVVGVTCMPDAIASKSRIAARLASVLAEPARARVLLMEGDFDEPSVHRLMRIDMPIAAGFSEQVRRRMKGAKPRPWSIVRCSATLQVLAEGRVRAPGLLATVQFMDGISELRRYYDIIVLDGPAAGSVDARVLDEIADGLVVVGANEAAMPEVRQQAAQWFTNKRWMATLPAVVDSD
jgi:Mrp family chromosome partitioning ATPase